MLKQAKLIARWLGTGAWGSRSCCRGAAGAQETSRTSSYSPVVIKVDFATTMERMKGEKAAIMERQMKTA